jgi:hypothetical protein
MLKRKWVGIAVLLVVGMGVCTWARSTGQGRIPYVPQGAPKASSLATRCSPWEEECIILGIYCVEYRVDTVCHYTCVGLCATACAIGLRWLGIPCAYGCDFICREGCKRCVDWDVKIYCYCPGDPIPTTILVDAPRPAI